MSGSRFDRLVTCNENSAIPACNRLFSARDTAISDSNCLTPAIQKSLTNTGVKVASGSASLAAAPRAWVLMSRTCPATI